MTKDDIIGHIIKLVHQEVLRIPADVQHLVEGLQSAPARTALLDRLVQELAQVDDASFVPLLEVLNDRTTSPFYPEVRLLQQWQHMSIQEQPLDKFYVADLLFSKKRAGLTLSPAETIELQAIADIEYVHPWPVGYTPSNAAATPGDNTDPVPVPLVKSDLADATANTSLGVTSQVVQAAQKVGLDMVQAPLVKSDPADVPPQPFRHSGMTAPTMMHAYWASVDAAAQTAANVVAKPQEQASRTPVEAYQEKRGMIEDVALANGVPIVSGKEWRSMQMPRTDALLVADFDFATIAREGVGRAAYLLVGPESKDDIRIELKSQSTSGSAGDKLPTSLLRLVNAAKTQSYGSAVVGVVGLQFFAPEALTLAREVAGKSSRVRLLEGPENFVDALQTHVTDIKARHEVAKANALPDNDYSQRDHLVP